jgi:hypothetical protein
MHRRRKIPGKISSTTSADVPRARAQRDARDLDRINRNADRLNADALDGLEYQAPVDFDEDAP